ncbi:16S rRNA (cytosine(1402)-N(4))-methyltransferase RsmH [Helicobacter sp. MIT 14-3879]|uniref:16S rRNA (cytosine(1402)-N(4))-methyltransferase RsmH n=1 Tax=Helicobacter sp. MIT 14-3879 TaxID=2040649 RepID=UPI000E1E8C3C|nr:16S rRNA (cytosine(1402)-N(4))-methyltransferase RsmH [Helicobacter sp. MIT 14-3879]RDU64672.1 16S rRNA (cytosine(1402)-N(4))-methyltransferase [Helicobacter sp. MIT 14-3879]
MIHQPVLLNEVREFFSGISGVFIDATLGLGGHSYFILRDNPNVKCIGIDRDRISLDFAKKRLSCFSDRFIALNGSFSAEIKNILASTSKVNGILADIGVSSPQLDNLDRGFSFESDNLDMRMSLDSTLNAKIVINSYPKNELNRIFRDFGEISNYEAITKLILDYRKNKKIESAKELCQILESKIKHRGLINPATLVFQAIRIEVNDELNELKKFLNNIEKLRGTKVAIISFHSLEDKIIKNTFRNWARDCICSSNVMKCECGGGNAKGKILTKKPIIPTDLEISQNRRSRSAKMRGFIFNE